MGKDTMTRLAALMLLVAGTVPAKTVRLVYTDAQGTVIAKTDLQGNILARYDYRPYGAPVSGGLPEGPGYTGHVNDAGSGLVYMQQRYYDPGIGRFLSVDPVTADGNTGGNLNRYWYASNNPYRFTDPDGRLSCDWCHKAWESVLQFVGIQSSDAGAERARESAQVRKLSPTDSAGREAIKADSRARTPSMVRRIIEAGRPSLGPRPGTGGRANVPNAGANAVGKVLRGAGNFAVAFSVANQVVDIANSPEPARATARAGGQTLGAIGGGEGGVWIGAGVGFMIAGPPGAGVGAIIGGLGGSALGGHYGGKATEALYDEVNH